MGAFLLNAWYVAGWSDEVTQKPLARTLLGRPVVLFRTEDDTPVAMLDRCPHRFIPLSQGQVAGDEIICPYHGLTFNAAGRCTHERAAEALRDRFAVPTFAAEDRYGSLWIWMGDQSRADRGLIPDFSFLDAPTHILAGRGLTHIAANYLLEIDNLLDLSHLDFVHAKTISNGLVTSGRYEVYQNGATVHSDWMIPDTPAPRQFADLIALSDDPRWDAVKGGQRVDHWLDMRWEAPGTLFLDVGVAPSGLKREAPIDMPQAHFVTPETETSTHYFWKYTMTKLGQPQALLDGFLKVVEIAFGQEDKPMLEMQQCAMKGANFWAEEPMILPEDAGSIRARRVLEKLIREEQAGASQAAAQIPPM